MQRRSDAGETLMQVEGGCVEELIGNAEDASGLDGTQVVPVSLRNHTFKRDAISSAAPCKQQHVRIGFGDGFGSRLRSRLAHEVGVAGGDQLGNPGLRMDERLAPLFAVDGLPRQRLRGLAGVSESGLQIGYEGLSRW